MSASEHPIEQLAASYLSGNASPEEKEKLEAWIRANEANRRYYQQLKNIWEAGRPAFPTGQIDTEKAARRVMSRIKKRAAWYESAFVCYWQRIAAVLLLPLIGSTVYLYVETQGNRQPSLPAPLQEITVPYGTHARITLPDSSQVWLNAGSTLRYPAFFPAGSERKVDLRGEGYFEVKADAQHPFIVHTPRLTVTATGTAFNVNAYETDSVTAVTLTEGKVRIALGKTPAFALAPGEQVLYNQVANRYRIQQTDPYKWYAWKDGRLVFRDDPLEYVFKRIGRTFNVDIRIEDATLGRHVYRATFENESLDEILRLLQMTAPIAYDRPDREKSADNSYKKQYIRVYRIN